MTEVRWDVPPTWCWTGVGAIAKIIGGGTPATADESNFSNAGIPWLTPADLTNYNGTYIKKGRRDLSERGLTGSSATLMPAGTVLFSSRAPIGYCVIASNKISTNQGFKSLILMGNIQPEYIRYYLLGSRDYAESLASGTTFKELSGSRMAQLSVPIPPVAEQRRIVAKLDQLFAQTNNTNTALAHVPNLIKQYTQALLRQAYSGQLSAEWRLGAKTGSQSRIEGDFLLIGEDGANLVARSTPIAFEVSGQFWVNNHAHVLRATAATSNSWIRHFVNWINLEPYVTGSAQPKLTQRHMNEIHIPVPPVEEQRFILSQLEKGFAWLATVLREQEKVVSLLPRLNESILMKAFRGALVPQDVKDEPADKLLARIQVSCGLSRLSGRGRRITSS